jgi:hypothetical protein
MLEKVPSFPEKAPESQVTGEQVGMLNDQRIAVIEG